MEATNGAIALPDLNKGKPPTVETDDWLVGLLSTLWHSRDRQSAETRDIVESNVNPKEADIASGLFSGMPRDLQNQLQEHTVLHLDSLENKLGQYLPALLHELRAGPLLTKSTTSVPYYVHVFPASFPVSETAGYDSRPPSKPPIDINARYSELHRFLKDSHCANQHENIRTAIGLYDGGYVPSAQSVFIQKGKVVSIDELILARDGPPYWIEVHHFFILYCYSDKLKLIVLILGIWCPDGTGVRPLAEYMRYKAQFREYQTPPNSHVEWIATASRKYYGSG
jgi:hypothetical protein